MTAHPGQHIRRFRDRRNLPPVGADRLDQRHKRVKLPGAEHEIKVRQLVQQFVPEPLRHAAERADHQLRFSRLELPHITDFALRLAFGLLADAAGVEEQHIRRLLRIDHHVTGFGQHSGQRFGVALVHLAAVSFDMDFHGIFKVRLSR